MYPDKTMKRIIVCSALIISALLPGLPLFSWDSYDSVIAVVNDISIIESEVDSKFNQLVKVKRIPPGQQAFEKSRVLDKFIEDALVMEAATDEAIVVSDRRVLTQIEELMKQFFAVKFSDSKKLDKFINKMINRLEKKLSDEPLMDDKELDAELETFIKFIEGRFQIGFRDYFEELRSQIMREQVMSIAIGVSPPSKEESMEWFKKNRHKLGDEVWVKQILIRPSGGSFTAEREANKKISEIREKILHGESFEKLARAYSQDPESAGKGGDCGWKMLAEYDPYFAGYVNNLSPTGQISQVFKSGLGYHIAKLMGRKPITYEKVERLIMFKLYNENMYYQFKKWVDRRKKESEIQILMKNYVRA
jgi:putative peptidyl-prolyl cis-trans isomerase